MEKKDKVELMPASELAKITLTDEQANEKQIREFAEGMFQDLHKRATQFGRRNLDAPISTDDKALPLAKAVVDLFAKLGYDAEIVEDKQTVPIQVEEGDVVKTENKEVVVGRRIEVSF